MADVFETSVKLKFIVPAGEVDRIKKIVEAATGSSFTGKVGGAASVFGKSAMGLGMAAGIAGALVVSSPQLQNTLKVIANTLGMILRPIGDIVAIGLRPIIDILRPIGIFFRILIKPYIDKAREAMQLGRQFAMRGEYGLAGQAYAAGAAFLLKPFFDEMVTAATISVQGVLAGIKLLGVALLTVLDPLDWVRTSFSDTMDSAIQSVGVGGAKIIVETSVMMENWLVTLKEAYKKIEDHAKISMDTTQLVVGEGFVRIIQSATNFFAPNLESVTNKMFDNIIEYAVKKINELNTALNKGPMYIVGGNAYNAVMTPGGPVCAAPGNTTSTNYPPTWNIPNYANPFSGAGGGGSSGAGDFVWRPGQAPIKFSSNDTITGTKGETTKSITVGDIIIRVDRISSDVDVRRMSSMVRDEVINALRTMV
jgi:hypothetical protein